MTDRARIGQVSPRSRVLALIGVAVGVFLLPELWQLVFVLAGHLALWLVVDLPPRRLLRHVTKLWVFFLFIVGSYALFESGPGTDRWVKLSLGGFGVSVNTGGAVAGLCMVVRVMCVVLASQLARAGDPRAIAAGLRQLKVPRIFALSLDIVLALLADGGGGRRRGGGGGGGRGGGRGRHGGSDETFWQSLKRLATGDVQPILRRLERQIDRAQSHADGLEEGRELGADVGIVSGIALTMMAIKMMKVLPSLPFAPGHKMVLLTPLYIAAALLTRGRWGATLTGVVMGSVAFLMGDGRYGVFEILKHVVPGVICDLGLPLLMRSGRAPGRLAWSAFGALIGVGRFTTVFCVTLAVQPPAIAYAILVPGLTVNVFFGVASGYVSHKLVKALVWRHDGAGPDEPKQAEVS